ncbi:hypothetical protein JDV02_008849 [Purpureocillium takamizusanense]|uniref:Uncharacterized protein n=1 Tax=Purpureocillium takamizusanense TaxID=2060973 RepID=A0A9Q8QPJ0_9HYPO|nr:uncharacterized protein JDV02_008849 [Purpureocillium takamizusanense]UNI23007.1 hypothetical protein JDV02_008849 [Purpureocillium takamizusanense]
MQGRKAYQSITVEACAALMGDEINQRRPNPPRPRGPAGVVNEEGWVVGGSPSPPSLPAQGYWPTNSPQYGQADVENPSQGYFGPEGDAPDAVADDPAGWPSVVGHPSVGPGSSRDTQYTRDFVLFDEESTASADDDVFPFDAPSGQESSTVDALGQPLVRGNPHRNAQVRQGRGRRRPGQAANPRIAEIGAWDESRLDNETMRVPAVDFDRELDRSLSSRNPFPTHGGTDNSRAPLFTDATFCACCECVTLNLHDPLATNGQGWGFESDGKPADAQWAEGSPFDGAG